VDASPKDFCAVNPSAPAVYPLHLASLALHDSLQCSMAALVAQVCFGLMDAAAAPAGSAGTASARVPVEPVERLGGPAPGASHSAAPYQEDDCSDNPAEPVEYSAAGFHLLEGDSPDYS
jgi:hypothetical protein